MATTKTMRNVNINMRTTDQEKSLLQKAAEIAGFSNLTNFIMTAARKEANRVLSDIHTTYVTPRDWDVLNELVSTPPAPNARLKKLLSDEE